MLRSLVGALVTSHSALAIVTGTVDTKNVTENGISIKCNNDQTVDVNIDFDIAKSQILSLKYGKCNETMVRNLDQNANNGFNFTLDSNECGMTGLRSYIDYAQKVEVVVGKKDQNQELFLALFEVDAFCQLKAEYTIEFSYGNLSAQVHDFNETGGVTKLNFDMAAYNADWTKKLKIDEQPSQAGDIINIGVKVTTPTFDNNITSFSMKQCVIKDTMDSANTYTLFDAEVGSCNNDLIKLTVGYDNEKAMWQIAHMLFLLGSYDTSAYSLTCKILVCDNQDNEECKKLNDNCDSSSKGTVVESKCIVNAAWRDSWFDNACDVAFATTEYAYGADVEGFWGEDYHDSICSESYLGGSQVINDDTVHGKWWDNCCPGKHDSLSHCFD